MDSLQAELDAIGAKEVPKEGQTNPDVVFIYSILGVFVLLCVWIAYIVFSGPRKTVTVNPGVTSTPVLNAVNDPKFLIPPAVPRRAPASDDSA